MGPQVIDRRTLIATGLAATLLPTWAGADIPSAPPVPRTVKLPVSPTRATDMTVWEPTGTDRTTGVALLSTGHGSWPERYAALAGVLALCGYVTLAPMHVDSVRYPERAKFSMQASFGERIADMAAASAYAAKAYPGLPVIAVGHSFGTLTALCRAGALGYLGNFRDPTVKAVLGFSSPGRVPGLVQPTAYAGVTVPLMLITGTADVVPGFVTDPADHLLPVETVKGPAYGLVIKGADHEFVGRNDPGIWSQRPLVGDFAAAHALGDAAARTRLARWKPAAGDRYIVRNAA
jgi:predicted dienelactone hydrolase